MCVKHYKAQYHKATYEPIPKRVCTECGAEHWGKKGLCGGCYEIAYNKSGLRKAVLARHAQTESFKQAQTRHRKKYPQKIQARTNAYRALMRSRQPAWANQRYINLFYQIAQLESKATGKIVEVDHIYPLRGKTVCGLHVEDNMQLLFKSDNCRKGNRL